MSAAEETVVLAEKAKARKKTLYLTDGEVNLIIDALEDYGGEEDQEEAVNKLYEKMRLTRQRRSEPNAI